MAPDLSHRMSLAGNGSGECICAELSCELCDSVENEYSLAWINTDLTYHYLLQALSFIKPEVLSMARVILLNSEMPKPI